MANPSKKKALRTTRIERCETTLIAAVIDLLRTMQRVHPTEDRKIAVKNIEMKLRSKEVVLPGGVKIWSQFPA